MISEVNPFPTLASLIFNDVGIVEGKDMEQAHGSPPLPSLRPPPGSFPPSCKKILPLTIPFVVLTDFTQVGGCGGLGSVGGGGDGTIVQAKAGAATKFIAKGIASENLKLFIVNMFVIVNKDV